MSAVRAAVFSDWEAVRLKKAYVYIGLTVIFFSSMEVALKLSSLGFHAIQMNFIRFFIGSLVLLPLGLRSLRRRSVRLTKRDWGFFALTGFVGVVVSMTLYQLAVGSAKASIVAILFSCNPVFVIPFAYFMLGEPIHRTTVVSMLLSVAGILCIMNPLHMSAGAAGIALTLLSAVAFALYGVIGKKRTARYGGLALTAFSFLAGSVEMLALILLTEIPPVAAALSRAGLGQFAAIPVLRGLSLACLPALLYVGVCVTGLGYAFYFMAMEETSAATASTVFFIKPALAPLIALAVLGEPITGNMLVGIGLVIGGSLVKFIRSKAGEQVEREAEKEIEDVEEELDGLGKLRAARAAADARSRE